MTDSGSTFAIGYLRDISLFDRFGMAQAIAKLTKNIIYGDLMFNIGVPVPMRSYSALRAVASALLPIITRVPFQWVYPTGEKQDKTEPKYQNYYEWADVIAGDYLIIKRTMPTIESGILEGKIIITNTVTPEDTKMMIERKVKLLTTSTPCYEGRYIATNLYEGILITLMGKRPDEVTAADYDDLLQRLNWRPTITDLSQLSASNA